MLGTSIRPAAPALRAFWASAHASRVDASATVIKTGLPPATESAVSSTSMRSSWDNMGQHGSFAQRSTNDQTIAACIQLDRKSQLHFMAIQIAVQLEFRRYCGIYAMPHEKYSFLFNRRLTCQFVRVAADYSLDLISLSSTASSQVSDKVKPVWKRSDGSIPT